DNGSYARRTHLEPDLARPASRTAAVAGCGAEPLLAPSRRLFWSCWLVSRIWPAASTSAETCGTSARLTSPSVNARATLLLMQAAVRRRTTRRTVQHWRASRGDGRPARVRDERGHGSPQGRAGHRDLGYAPVRSCIDAAHPAQITAMSTRSGPH